MLSKKLATAVRMNAPIPNTYNETKKAGINAITTSYITFFEVLLE